MNRAEEARWRRRPLHGADDLYTALAADTQLVPAGCIVVAHRKLACADDLYTALAAKT